MFTYVCLGTNDLERATAYYNALLAPMGGNLEGVRAASLAYFGKEPRQLSAAEAALLVAIPQSPERRRPDIALARDRLGWEPTIDLRDGLTRTVEWFRTIV